MTSVEPPRGPASPTELRWTRQRMVQWFDPLQLRSTAIRALLSDIFGSYADKREVQAALSRDGQPSIHRYDAEEELWVDYVADLGDGFDSTYTIAWLLAQPHLPAAGDTARDRALAATCRGRVLVMGGDQVYPTASREAYENRLAGPYSAALPWAPEAERPRLFAIPGNHDWYDGLTAFLRQFCQQRWIGGWQTRQSRSYFALQLPNRWWLLGIDVQLDSDIDQPQLDYFGRVAQEMREGDQVILCTAEPVWVSVADRPTAYDNLAFFERTVLCPRGAKLMLTLTGDLHHYARYSDSLGQRHKITAGGGGAYLYGTHLLPPQVELPKADPAEPGSGRARESKTYTRQGVYPRPAVSHGLRWGALRLPFKNPRFGALLAVLYTLFAWFLQLASRQRYGGEMTLMNWLRDRPLSDAGAVLYLHGDLVVHSPLLLAMALLFVGALYQFCVPDPGKPRWFKGLGAVHGLAHLLLVVGLTWAFAWLNVGVLGLGLDWQAPLFVAEMLLFGGVLGGLLMGLALLPGINFNEAYSAQHLESHKNFVRLHLDRGGALTVYPVGVERVKRWCFVPNAEPGKPYFAPADGRLPRPHLIEEPVVIPAPAPPPSVHVHAVVRGEGA